ncbi:MAG: peptidoglycan editing factor PgeF [Pseudomonadota bacterium]
MSGAVSGWIVPDWPAPPGVTAVCTTREGGVSRGPFASLNLAAHVDDDPAAVAANRQRLCDELGLERAPLWLNQVHGSAVVDAASPGEGIPTADASYTFAAGQACAVLTADCLPVLFAARDGSAVAAAHAGWRGLAAGVLEATLARLSLPADSVLAWLGPAISQAAFEVGDEVREAFVAADGAAAGAFLRNDAGRWQADLYALARLRLEAAGLTAVYGGGLCTHSDADRFFSYRRLPRCGRIASLIAIDRP